MDMMDLRRQMMGVIAGMANRKCKTGTFIGNGTITVSINIGFKPDVIAVFRDSKTLTPGVQNVVFVRDHLVTNEICYTVSGTPTTQFYSTRINEGEDEWGDDDTNAYRSFATFADGILTISNRTNGGRCYFLQEQYTWMAYKV